MVGEISSQDGAVEAEAEAGLKAEVAVVVTVMVAVTAMIAVAVVVAVAVAAVAVEGSATPEPINVCLGLQWPTTAMLQPVPTCTILCLKISVTKPPSAMARHGPYRGI